MNRGIFIKIFGTAFLMTLFLILPVQAQGKEEDVKPVRIHAVRADDKGNEEEFTSDPEWMEYYSQTDGAWANVVIGKYSTMAKNGCVPTSASMILSHFDITVNPVDMAKEMYNWGDYNSYQGHGGAASGISNMADTYGLSCWGCYSYDEVKEALLNGAIVDAMIYYRKGTTHSVVITGFDQYGKTTVYDPYAGIYQMSVKRLWNARSFVKMDRTGCGNFTAIRYKRLEGVPEETENT